MEPCLVCKLQKAVAETAATKDVQFATTPLQLNIVGVRSEDSLSNRFDDLMAVFFQLLPPESGPAFEKAVEADLREDMKACVQALPGGFRYVACSQQGLWVVGLFTMTTDPGFEDSPEALEKQKARYEQELKAADGTVEKLSPQEERLTKAHEKAKAARAALLAKRKKGVPPPKPELPDAVEDLQAPTLEPTSLGTFIKNVKKRLDALADAREVQKSRPGLIEQRQAAIERKTHENEVRKGHLPTFQYHKGWVGQGRAIVPVGHHADAYRFYLHKAGSAEGFPSATVALSVPAITKGLRVYSVKHLCTASERKKLRGVFSRRAKGEILYIPKELRQLWPASGAVQRYVPGAATLELVDKEPPEGQKSLPAGTPQRELFLVEDAGKKRTQLALDAHVVITDAIHGTNIHRAHNVTLSADRTRLDGYAARADAEVNSWSEGCQTFTDFFEFNAFIRLCAVSKRWGCARTDPTCLGAESCARLEGEERGEKELMKRFGEPFIHLAMAVDCRKDAEALGSKIEKLRKERDGLALTLEEQEQLSSLEARKAQTAPQQTRSANPGAQPLSRKEEGLLSELVTKRKKSEEPAIVAELHRLDARIQELTTRRQELLDCAVDAENEVRLGELPDDIVKADARVEALRLEADDLQAQLDAVPQKGRKPMSPKARRRLEARREETTEDLEEAKAKKQSLETEKEEREKTRGLQEATLRRRREFLRERARMFRADFLRGCDLSGTCKVRFHYTLVELNAPRLEDLKRQFKSSGEGPWTGGFLMGQEAVHGG